MVHSHDSHLHGKMRRDSVARTRDKYECLLALLASHQSAHTADRVYLAELKCRIDTQRRLLKYKNAL
jgi:hypothetical protein